MSENYLELLPLQDHVFATERGVWESKVSNQPRQGFSDRVLFRIYFEIAESSEHWRGPSVRNLNLYVSDFQLHHRHQHYVEEVCQFIKGWLESDAVQEELEFLGTRGAGR